LAIINSFESRDHADLIFTKICHFSNLLQIYINTDMVVIKWFLI